MIFLALTYIYVIVIVLCSFRNRWALITEQLNMSVTLRSIRSYVMV